MGIAYHALVALSALVARAAGRTPGVVASAVVTTGVVRARRATVIGAVGIGGTVASVRRRQHFHVAPTRFGLQHRGIE